jgi:hypothetical protein
MDQGGRHEGVGAPDTQPGGASGDSRGKLRWVLSPSATPAAALLVKRRLAGMSQEEIERTRALEVNGVVGDRERDERGMREICHLMCNRLTAGALL